MADLATPLMPATVDLRDFQFMPIDVRRLLTSETWMLGDGEERAAAMTLWLESWHQVPAGSLPNNDRMLAHLAQCPRWSKVKRHALRGWVECADGRLYHPVVCEKALEAWLSKLSERLGAAEGNAKRWGTGFDPAPYLAEIREAAEKLRALNPHSKALAKKQLTKAVKSSPPESPPDSGSESPPDSGDDSREDRKRQYKGQGQGQGQGYISLSHTHTRACARDESGQERNGKTPIAHRSDPQSELAAFERVKSAYPKFAGRQDWVTAEHHCRLRIDQDGLTWDDLEAAARRYAAYVAAGGVSGPQYVMTPAKFFSSPDKPWLQPWTPPPKKPEQRLAANLAAAAEAKRRLFGDSTT